MLAKNFTVAISVYTSGDGVQYVIPDSEELDLFEKTIEDSEKEADIFLTGAEDQQAMGKGQKAACVRMRQDLEKKRKIREQYKTDENTQRESYTVLTPLYGMYLQAESEARTVDEDGTVSIDETKLMKSLLVQCLPKIDALELPPAIARVIYNEIRKRAFPDFTNLPFKS